MYKAIKIGTQEGMIALPTRQNEYIYSVVTRVSHQRNAKNQLNKSVITDILIQVAAAVYPCL